MKERARPRERVGVERNDDGGLDRKRGEEERAYVQTHTHNTTIHHR